MGPTNEHHLLEVRHIAKSFVESGRAFQVIQDIDFFIRENEFVCIVGPSDAGKSTLLRMIAGLEPPTAGEILYRDELIRELNLNVSLVFQTFALLPWLTVMHNILIGLEARGISRTDAITRAERYVDAVGLDGFEEAYPRELSRGMKQRVGLARALVVEPELLLMDEPFSNLDVLSARNLREEILDLWQDRSLQLNSVLMVTNSIEEAVYMADRVVIISERPGRTIGTVTIPLPRPRRVKDPALAEVADEIYAMIL